MPRRPRTPAYCLHKPTGQAYVRLNGRCVYLGTHGTPESRAEYDRVIAEWLDRGRVESEPALAAVTVKVVIAAYWRHVESYYVKNGKPTCEQGTIRQAMKILRRLYGDRPVSEFGPSALKAVRQAMIERGWCRGHVNGQVSRVRALFRWAAEHEIIPAYLHQRLTVVTGLRKGRADHHGARETEPVRPVPEALIEAVRPYVSRQVWAMVQFQLLTGCRPGEACAIRARDLDMGGAVWLYTPAGHKAEHHGKPRVIAIGPHAQEIVRPWLGPDLQKHLFSPAEAEAERLSDQRARRKTRVQPSQQQRAEQARRRAAQGKRQRPPRDRYDVDSYRKAVQRGCDQAFPPPAPLARRDGETLKAWRARLTDEERHQLRAWQREHRWHPHQLRHTAATRIRREYGIDVARAVLGHASATMTGLYAELDTAKAIDAMAKMG